jgi:putative ATP-binding cassette transporter
MPSLWAASLFLIALFFFNKSQNYILITATVEIESIIHNLRVRLLDEVRKSELVPLERIGRARIVSAITGDTAVLTQAADVLVFSIQNIVVIFFVEIYVAYLSPVAFLLSIIIVLGATIILHSMAREIAVGRREAADWSDRLFDRLIDVLDGFKELRLNKLRSDQLFDDAVEVSRTASHLKIQTNARNCKRMIFSQVAMYLLLAAIAFVAPVLGNGQEDSITKATLVLLFVVGAAFGLVQSIPMLATANGAADRLAQLEKDLLTTVKSADLQLGEGPKRFDEIEVRNSAFRFVDRSSETTFMLGPIDFTLHCGDLVFINGGNGSGKSTFLKLLAGLYVPEEGELMLDGKRIDDGTRARYRALISAIFTDYHLFQRLYGVANPDEAEIEDLLTQFQLIAKTRLADGEFSTLNLSTGQRKRLALVVAILEKRPVLLLDEWASDQDPEFRRKFYEEVLPTLNRRGVTIVAVTHDDRHLADLGERVRLLRMEEGRFVEGEAGEGALS